MLIAGFRKTSFIDYPGQPCAVVFTPYCNMNCSYCHNEQILRGDVPLISEDEVMDYLEKRAGLLKAVTISGGEPTLQQNLIPFIETVKKALEAQVSDVRVSTRLTDSPCCLVAKEYAMPPSMVRMMKAMKQEVPDEKRILELNAEHPLVKKIAGLTGAEQADAVALLYDSALIAEGSPVTDGARFTKLLADLMLK